MNNYSAAATIAISVIGWIIVHYLSAQRDKQKEWREFSRNTVAYIESIEKDAATYHTAPKRCNDLEGKIKSDIDFLDLRIGLVAKRFKIMSDASLFRAAITLQNFETSNFRQQAPHSTLMQDITWHAKNLKEALYKAE